MVKRRELVVLQFIAASAIFLATQIDLINRKLQAIPLLAKVAIPSGAFVLLYQGLVHLYKSRLWFIIHREPNLTGWWAHGTQNTPEGQYFYGVFQIDQRADSFTLKNAEMWYEDKPPTSEFKRAVWTPDLCVIERDRIAVVYTSVRSSEVLRVSRQMLDLRVTGTRAEPQLNGNTYGLGHPTGSYGFTTAVRISKRWIRDAPELAFKMMGSRSANIHPLNVA